MKKIINKWPILLMAVSLLVMVFAGLKIRSYYVVSGRQLAKEKELQGLYQAMKEEKLTSAADNLKTESAETSAGQKPAKEGVMLSLEELNPDYVGWIEKADLKINYPVVQRDNTYYLRRNFEQKSDRHGTIFLDEKCNEDSVIHLLHGHHMRDGSMFAGLKDLENRNYLRENNTFLYDSGNGQDEYLIYAAMLVDFSEERDEENTFYYYRIPDSAKDYENWQKQLKQHSFYYNANVESELERILQNYYDDEKAGVLTMGAEIVVLSTCEYGTQNERLAIVGVRQGIAKP